MDRDGKIYRGLPDGTRGTHILPSEINNLSNADTEGMEVIAKNDKDITDAQVKSGVQFLKDLSKSHPGIQIFGHGQVNPSHKMHDEGKTIVDAFRNSSKETPNIFASDKAHMFIPVLKRTIGAFSHGSVDNDGTNPLVSTNDGGIDVKSAPGSQDVSDVFPKDYDPLSSISSKNDKAVNNMKVALQAHAFAVDTKAASTIHNFGIDKFKNQYAANRGNSGVNNNSINNLYTDKGKHERDTSKPGKTDAGKASPSHDRIKKLFTSYGGNGDGWV